MNTVQSAIAGLGTASQDAIERNTKFANTLIDAQAGLTKMAAAAEVAKGKTLELAGAAGPAGASGALGGAAEEAFKLQNALALATQEMFASQAALMGMSTEALAALMGWDTGIGQVAASAEQLEAEYTNLQNALAQGTDEMVGTMAALMGISEDALRVLMGQAPAIEASTRQTLDWRQAIDSTADVVDSLGGLLRQLGVDADSSLGRAVSGFQQLAGAAQDAAAAAAQWQSNPIGAVASGLKAVGGLIGGIKSLFGGGEAKKFREEMEKVRKETEKLRSDFIAAEGGIEELNRKAREAGITIDDMFSAKNADELKKAIDGIRGALDFQAEAQDRVREAAERYGIEISELGPTFAQQELDKMALQLIGDYDVLKAAQSDMVAVMAKMGPEFEKYVQEVIKAGGTVPKELQPIIEQLIAEGKLVDENGNAYKTAEEAGIKYGQSQSAMFEQQLDYIKRIAEAIERLAGIRVAPIRVPVEADYGDNFPGGGGGHVNPNKPGGHLPEFHQGGYTGDGGGAFPAMLNRGEHVNTTPQMQQLMQQAASMGAAMAMSMMPSGGGGGTVLMVDRNVLARTVSDVYRGGAGTIPASAIRGERGVLGGKL